MPGYSAAPIPASDAILLRPEEAASLLRLSRSKVYALIRDGQLCSVKIDGRRRVPRSAIDEYVASLLTADGTGERDAQDYVARELELRDTLGPPPQDTTWTGQIRRKVDGWPPLSPAQQEKLRELFQLR